MSLLKIWFLSPVGFRLRAYFCTWIFLLVQLTLEQQGLNRISQFSSVQLLSRIRLFATPWIAAQQASLSNTSSRSLLKLMSIESVMPTSHLILCRPLLLLPPIPPSIRVFSNESTLASASALPMNTQDWSPFGWTGCISLQSKWLSRVKVQKHQFFVAQVSLWSNSHIRTWPLEKP